MPSPFIREVRRRRKDTQRVFQLLAHASASRVDQSVFWAWLGLLAFGVLSFGAVEPWSLAIFQVGSALLLLWWMVAGMHRGNLQVTLLPIFVPALLFLGLILVQMALHTTAYRLETEHTLYLYIPYSLLVFVGAQVLDAEGRFRAFGISAILFGLSIALLAILQGLTSPGQIYWLVRPAFGDGVFGPYVNHSHYAGLMEMLFPFALLLGNSRLLPQGEKELGYFAAAVMAGSVFVSGSRGGIVAVCVQLCLIYFLVRKPSKQRYAGESRQRWLSLAAVVAVSGVVLWLGGQEMITRISSIRDPFGNTVGATRLLIFKDSLRMIAERPLLGWGGGVFQTVYPAFRSFSTDVVVNAAHNDYLQLLVEFGITGAALALLFLGLAYRRFGQLARGWKDSWPEFVSFSALLGTVGILVHSLTDFNLQVPANAAIFYVLCMIASHPAPNPALQSESSAPAFGSMLASTPAGKG